MKELNMASDKDSNKEIKISNKVAGKEAINNKEVKDQIKETTNNNEKIKDSNKETEKNNKKIKEKVENENEKAINESEEVDNDEKTKNNYNHEKLKNNLEIQLEHEIEILKNTIKEQEKILKNKNIKEIIKQSLDTYNVFDSDALSNYIDYSKVNFKDGKVQNLEEIISILQKLKPNFFLKINVKGETFNSSDKIDVKEKNVKNKLTLIENFLESFN